MNPTRTLWPYGILATFILFIAGTVALIVIACTHQTDLITANYYSDEVKFQSRLDQLSRTAQLNEEIHVTYDGAQLRINLSLPATFVTTATSGRIQLYRPSATHLDREVPLQLNAGGAQSLDAASLLPGLWKVRVHWTAQNQDYFVDKSVLIKRGA